MAECETKESLKKIAEEMLIEKETLGTITTALREELVRILHSRIESE